MGILRLLIIAVLIIAGCLYFLPKTRAEQVLERKLLKWTIFVCSVLIIGMGIALYVMRDTLWHSHDFNVITKKIQTIEDGVQKITITNYDLKNVNAKLLDKVFKAYPELKIINIVDLTVANAHKLAELLNQHSAAVSLQLANMSAASIGELFQNLSTIANLQEVTFSRIELTRDAMAMVANFLVKVTSLQKLSFSDSNIGEMHVDLLANAIASSSFRALELRYNELSDRDLQILMGRLSKVHSLQVLDLTGNFITSEGVAYLTDLANNRELNKLLLAYNSIDDDGAKLIAALIAKQGKLQVVDLNRNPITDIGVAELVAAAQSADLPELRLTSVLISPDGKKLLESLDKE